MQKLLNPLAIAMLILLIIPFSGWAQQAESNQQTSDTLKSGNQPDSIRNISKNHIYASDFPENINHSVLEILQGRVNGGLLSIGAEGTNVNVNSLIRGGAGFRLQNEPLIEIDGLISPYSAEFLNIESIESIKLIKGAAETGLYGARGANGIIKITTKQAEKDEPFGVYYHGSTAFGSMPETVPMLSAGAFREKVYDLYGEDSEAAALLGDENTNWQEEFYRRSFSHSHYLGAEGVLFEKKLPYRAMIKFSNDQSNIITNTQTKALAKLDITPSFFDNSLKVHLKLNGFLKDGTTPQANDQIRKNTLLFDPTQPVYADNNPYGSYFMYVDNQGTLIPRAPKNPVADANMNDYTLESDGVAYQLNVQYELPFYNSITLNTNYSQSHVTHESESYFTEAFAPNENIPYPKQIISTDSLETRILNASINFKEYFDKLNIGMDMALGYFAEERLENYTYRTYYAIEAWNDAEGFKTQKNMKSLYSSVRVDYKSRYSLLVGARRDGLAFYAQGNRYEIFPSAAFIWDIANEEFMQGSFISNLSLKAGYGKTSNHRDGSITQDADNYDRNLSMPITTTKDIQLSYGVMENRIIGSVSLYQKQTEGVMLLVPVPSGTDLTSYVVQNHAEVENSGVELSLSALVLKKKNLDWQFGLNLSSNTNEVKQIVKGSEYATQTGDINGSFDRAMINQVGNPIRTFYLYEQIYDENGIPVEDMYADQNGDGSINRGDLKLMGNPMPDFSIGFHSRLSFNRMTLSLSGRAWQGNQVYNNVASQFGYTSRIYNDTHLLNIHEESPFVNPQYLSDYYLEDAGFIKVDNITLSYAIPEIAKRKIDMKLYVSLYDAITITDYSGADPEVAGGIDRYNNYPSSTVFMLGVKAGL